MIEIDDEPIEGMIALGSGSDASDQEIKNAVEALGIKTTLTLDEMVAVFKMYHKDCSDSEIAVSLGDRKKMRNVERVRVKCGLFRWRDFETPQRVHPCCRRWQDRCGDCSDVWRRQVNDTHLPAGARLA